MPLYLLKTNFLKCNLAFLIHFGAIYNLAHIYPKSLIFVEINSLE